MGALLAVNAPHVVHETIDGEAILIHLVTGTYYSLDRVGAELWGVMAAGADPELLVAAAAERYDGDPAEIALGLSGWVEQLLREGLLIEDESQPAADSPRLPTGRVPFAVPVLNTYADMQEFMLVDPLNQVDEVAGWPHAKTG